MVTAMPGGRRRIDHIMAPEFLADLPDLPMATVRERRQTAMQEEADLSYVRRMLQGRIEILTAELDTQPDESDDELVQRLTRALVQHTATPGVSSRHLVAEPTRLAERRRYVERVIADVGLSDVGAMTPDEVRAAIARLTEQEQLVSRTRGEVHEVIDTLTSELARRYQTGQV
ncbi:MAG: aerial mycelium formation protein [Candidatus Nanopelagicales bacterium]